MSDEFEIRKEKVEVLRKAGIEPYQYHFEITHQSNAIKEHFDELENKEISIAGRLMTKRVFGKLSFAHIRDENGDIQIAIQQGTTKVHCSDEDGASFFKKFVDTGDIIGINGKVFKTKTGEITILVEKLTILSKCLRPIPEKWHGLRDRELIYRERYLDLIMNIESRETFVKRAKIIKLIRSFFDEKGFIEVETPILQPVYGGAFAKPFETYSNALNTKLYLRIADELYLKRLLVGGLEKVYEISKDFRNEGIDRLHYPEFTMLEAYASYWDYNDMMNMTEELMEKLAMEIMGGTEFEYQGEKISLKRPYKKLSYLDELSSKLGKDPLSMGQDELRRVGIELGLPNAKKLPPNRLLDKLFDALVADQIKNPTFVVDHPVLISPLAKKHRKYNDRVERFELFILGVEFANAFSELNDPIAQRERFEEQVRFRDAGDEEIPKEVDEDFLNAMEYGMPPAGGIGFGIDRIIMLLTNQYSIRDVIVFPQLKPKTG
ncbi:MAG TPA: lysine--tRNA ligase [Candidatus Hydrothermia bacterium]|nr:lysine--tRNA ligase [Candidatus Hydrothermae bacterium]MDD3649566.1 lysine--tRNA ligase [Candidatus Hydrothermia bacterium]HOK23478.1 lysine--tRNA ligase [Candidatus Hydrothermia bacterium]HOL24020.1 lysine--tRNA ligase [Candidatus Hydrothermia bacterium]HOP32781.1 lysine--tRNA ligase [Candidatus Hydrothermia bacterium]